MAAPKPKIVEPQPDVYAQLEVLRNDISELTKTIKTQAKATAKAKGSMVVDTATAKAAETKAKYDELTTTAEKSIRENPLASIAIALGAGVFLGLISRR